MFKKGFKHPKFFRKSQAALEFLTTYAWAFLVILIMIGALAYFGVLKPSKILPDRCNFGTEIGCIDYQIGFGTIGTGDGTFSLRLKNNLGEPIVIVDPAGVTPPAGIVISTESVADFNCALTGIGTTDPPVGVTDPFSWNSDEVINILFSTCDTSAVGFLKADKGKVFVTIKYHLAKSSTTYTHEVAGEVVSTVI